ncbi:MAG: response regulator [Akkermansiaceae bacterium]
MSQPVKITIIEDNPSFLETLTLTIEWDDSLKLLSKFGTAEIALRELSKSIEKPDLILLDLHLPGMSGLEALPGLFRYCPDTKVLVLSQSDAQRDILRAITLGASGYLVKSNDMESLLNSIKITHQGGALIDPAIARYLIDAVKRTQSEQEQHPIPLSERETEILQLLAKGLIKKEIADHFDISYNTVDSYVRRIFDKLDARNANSAISIAHRLGLID